VKLGKISILIKHYPNKITGKEDSKKLRN